MQLGLEDFFLALVNNFPSGCKFRQVSDRAKFVQNLPCMAIWEFYIVHVKKKGSVKLGRVWDKDKTCLNLQPLGSLHPAGLANRRAAQQQSVANSPSLLPEAIVPLISFLLLICCYYCLFSGSTKGTKALVCFNAVFMSGEMERERGTGRNIIF